MGNFWFDALRPHNFECYAQQMTHLQDSVYIYNKFSPISYDLWCYIRKIVDYVADHWHLKDHGNILELFISAMLSLIRVARNVGDAVREATLCIFQGHDVGMP